MLIHTAGKRSLALFFDQGELIISEKDSEQALCHVRQLAKEAFQKRGIEAKDLAIEAYEWKTGMVIFVCAEENPCLTVFSFEKITDAANAARHIGARLPMDSALINFGGRYYLKMYVRANLLEQAQLKLGEFGRKENCEELFCTHLEEMGKTVIYQNATKLLECFW